ncbi:TetR/AcrR family transcriptional regulator [Shewanella zhangzhouensis]|uniref:TetR/AcrR family transcriptional regulator n=1 Tax=Shewanella zhangzhouensis TaxID=2864213 RepID=UPI001C660C48|nr:TetR/AcrR family transcriptional regulator [Shewanella zhangzhouensis]QYK05460.1 TetR/AcrR family transcriptional regulator [Shewanella zhangzhouensis]
MSKREHILNVAEALFNEHGYTAVGVDLIRDTALVSKTSMYRHFGSKNLLIEAVLERRHQRWEDSLTSAMAAVEASATAADERLDILLNWHFDWFKQADFNGCMFMHAQAEFKGTDQAISGKAIHHKAWLKSMLANVVDPTLPDLRWRTESLMTLIEGMIVRAEFGELVGAEGAYRRAARALLTA